MQSKPTTAGSCAAVVGLLGRSVLLCCRCLEACDRPVPPLLRRVPVQCATCNIAVACNIQHATVQRTQHATYKTCYMRKMQRDCSAESQTIASHRIASQR
jgi:hypothetical protein